MSVHDLTWNKNKIACSYTIEFFSYETTCIWRRLTWRPNSVILHVTSVRKTYHMIPVGFHNITIFISQSITNIRFKMLTGQQFISWQEVIFQRKPENLYKVSGNSTVCILHSCWCSPPTPGWCSSTPCPRRTSRSGANPSSPGATRPGPTARPHVVEVSHNSLLFYFQLRPDVVCFALCLFVCLSVCYFVCLCVCFPLFATPITLYHGGQSVHQASLCSPGLVFFPEAINCFHTRVSSEQQINWAFSEHLSMIYKYSRLRVY